MDITQALQIAKISLELTSPFVSIQREALISLVLSANYNPEIRYKVHHLAGGNKVIIREYKDAKRI
jgi:hypothetical protein